MNTAPHRAKSWSLRLTWKMEITINRLKATGGAEVTADDFKGQDTCKPACLIAGVQVHELPTLGFHGELMLNLKSWDTVIWALALKKLKDKVPESFTHFSFYL